MRELANYTVVNPEERVKRYNNFMRRILSTPKVNIYLIIFKNSN